MITKKPHNTKVKVYGIVDGVQNSNSTEYCCSINEYNEHDTDHKQIIVEHYNDNNKQKCRFQSYKQWYQKHGDKKKSKAVIKHDNTKSMRQLTQLTLNS